MPKKTSFIQFFAETSKADIEEVGGKGSNLGEMTQAGLPVPPGFTVTSTAFQYFLKKTQLEKVIKKELKDLNRDDSVQLTKVANNIKDAIVEAKMPADIATEIKAAYRKLSKGTDAFVAVRSSATAEDLPGASFAGQQETFLDVRGIQDVLVTIQQAWASLYEPRAIFYREEKGFDHFKVSIAVPVQRMVQSEVSGVMFTIDPLTNDRDKVAIEAIYGLGDALVGGETTPDQYIYSKSLREVESTHIVTQKTMLGYKASVKAEEKVAELPVSKEYQKKQKLTSAQITELAELGMKVEKHYNFPQDIEWAYEDGTFYLVQTRPVTTIPADESDGVMAVAVPKEVEAAAQEVTAPVLLSGLAASPGVAAGPVTVIHSAKEIDKVKKGDILVTEMTTPDFVPAMRRAVAILTDSGGRTSHAAIVSRELGIPAVVGTELATKNLKNKEVITVNGSTGNVYEGDIAAQLKAATAPTTVPSQQVTVTTAVTATTKTATKLYVNLAEPDLAADMAERNVDGVGLLRAEFIIAQIGVHPRYALEKGQRAEYVDKLYEGLLAFAKAFGPRPVVYRTTDFRTNEYKDLKGGEKYEGHEENPMIGFRGVSRYIADPEVFQMELEAVKKVRRYHKNLHVMLPFVRTPEELIQVKKIMADQGLYRGGSFKIWMMVEVPSNVLILEKFIGAGIDGVSMGSNDLTQLILGVDRDNGKLGEIFDERHDAVMSAMKHVVHVCNKHGITSSICGQAPSVFPEITHELVHAGITSVSVSPDMIDTTRQIIAEAELNLIKNR